MHPLSGPAVRSAGNLATLGSLTLLCAVALAPAAQAQLTVTSNSNLTVTRPNTGSTTVTLFADISVAPDYDFSGFFLPFVSRAGSPFPVIEGTVNPTFFSYMAANQPGVGYSGALISYNIFSSTPLGLYDTNPTVNGPVPAFFDLFATRFTQANGFESITVRNPFSITVTAPGTAPVPEPSEWLAMGMAGTSVMGLMIRARRRKTAKAVKSGTTEVA